MASPRLKWLRIHRYRNVAPGTYLEFNDGFNVLLGRNGTGKTTLLDLIEMIWTRGFGKIDGEDFHLEYKAEFDSLAPVDPEHGEDPSGEIPGCTVHAVLRNNLERSEPERVTRDPASTAGFSYRVTLADVEGREALVVEGDPLGATLRIGKRSWAVSIHGTFSSPVLWSAPSQFFDLDHDFSAQGPESEGMEHLVSWAEWCYFMLDTARLSAVRFDESLAGFQALTDSKYDSHDRGVENVRWEMERRVDAETKVYPLNIGLFANVPGSLVGWCHRELEADVLREPPEFHVPHTAIPMLARFVEMTVYAAVRVDVRHLDRRRKRGIIEHLVFGPPDFSFVLPDDRGDIKADALSFGEKRLLSFLWYLECNKTTVIADELVNGFHHAWIERCVELIGDRQAFLASQNPLLLDCLPLKDEDYVRRCFITCRRGPETEGQMQWSNISAEEAADFYRSYSRATRYVHEILRGKGLW